MMSAILDLTFVQFQLFLTTLDLKKFIFVSSNLRNCLDETLNLCTSTVIKRYCLEKSGSEIFIFVKPEAELLYLVTRKKFMFSRIHGLTLY